MQLTISPSERLIAEIDGSTGWIVFNNPTKLNAMSLDMYEALIAVIDAYEHDPAVRVIALKGAGEKAFVSGGDLSGYAASTGTSGARRTGHHLAFQRLRDSTKPTVAMIHGYCIGGGLAVAMYCDLRIADETARFGLPQARLGRAAAVGMMQHVIGLIGSSYAREMAFTARQFTAAEAHAMGLINQVVPESELEDYVRKYCSTIAENAPLSIAASNDIINEIGKYGPQVDVAKCDALFDRCAASADYVEGPLAFREKRKAVFLGK
jgi:enoyl-CoA hydratase